MKFKSIKVIRQIIDALTKFLDFFLNSNAFKYSRDKYKTLFMSYLGTWI